MLDRKIFILDTSVLLYDKESIHSFHGNNIVIPLIVLEELDRFKERPGLIGDAARYVNRYLDKLREFPADDNGWKKAEGIDQQFKFEISPEVKKYIPAGLDSSRPDNQIIGTALLYKCYNDAATTEPNKKILVITKDINLRVKCDAVGVIAEDYYKDHIELEPKNLSGYAEVELEDTFIDEFYNEGIIYHSENLPANQYIIGKSATTSKSFLGTYKKNSIIKLRNTIDDLVKIEPRNAEQSFAIDALGNAEIPLVTLTGLAGSGKTFLALMAGLSHLRKTYDRVIITRTLQPVGRDLGYLPGDLKEKMQPWLAPIIDNVRHAFKDIMYFEAMVQKGEIEIAPIPYIRGRTFNNCYVIVDEAQNATIHELKTIITRIGQDSKIVLLGDVDQIDTPYIDRNSNGLSIVINKFMDSELAAHINLSKGQRSDLASTASNIL